MKLRSLSLALAATVFATMQVPALWAAINSPDDRAITDPRSLASRVNPNAGPVDIGDLFYTRTVNSASWSPDGREVAISTNLSGRFNIWKVAAAGGWPVQLLQSDDRQISPAWSPDGKWIVYAQDFGGGEYYDFYAVPASGGKPVNITNSPDVSEFFPLWSPDAKSIAFTRHTKSSSASDVAIMDFATRNVRMLTHEQTQDHGWWPIAWSTDGNYLFANRVAYSNTDSSAYRIAVSGGAAEELTPHTRPTYEFANSLSSDGKTLLIQSNAKAGSADIALVDIATKKLTWVTNLKWSATAGAFSPSGDRFTYSVNEDGRTELYISDRSTLKPVRIEMGPGVSAFSGYPNPFSPSGDRLLVLHQDSVTPADLWVYNVNTHAATQLSFSALASLDPARLPHSQLVHYKSFDGKVISAFVWLPDNLKRDGTNPAIVLPHGGPAGQVMDSFFRAAVALSSHGYICIAPNVRGSTGYGSDFEHANHMDLGGGDLQDEVYAARFLVSTGYVDAKRIGISGGSYGGFMTLMAISKTPDLWAAAESSYGIINWFTMMQHSDPTLRAYQRTLIGDPVKDRKVYEDDSPITFIRNAKAPLLVLQGVNDIRVPKEEAEQVVDILQKNHNVVAAHYYPGEGHGFLKREDQIDELRRTVEWFDKYLKK